MTPRTDVAWFHQFPVGACSPDEFKLRADALRCSRRPPPPDAPAERDRGVAPNGHHPDLLGNGP